MSSVNKVILIGNLGADPEIRTMQSGDRVANLSIATSESWKDKTTGEKKERTEWHRVVIFNKGLVDIVERFLKKGSKIYIEGQLETRSWESNGEKKYTTEVVLRPFRSELTMLSGKDDNQSSGGYQQSPHNEQKADGYQPQQQPMQDDLEDEIPF